MQIYACTRLLGKRTYYSFISNSLCSGGNAPMKSFMAWEYNMTKPTAYFEQNMVISQYQKHMGMGQNLLVSILMGWTSIYQLFCGPLGTRVMTHSHIANQSASLGEHLGVLDPRLQDMYWMAYPAYPKCNPLSNQLKWTSESKPTIPSGMNIHICLMWKKEWKAKCYGRRSIARLCWKSDT